MNVTKWRGLTVHLLGLLVTYVMRNWSKMNNQKANNSQNETMNMQELVGDSWALSGELSTRILEKDVPYLRHTSLPFLLQHLKLYSRHIFTHILDAFHWQLQLNQLGLLPHAAQIEGFPNRHRPTHLWFLNNPLLFFFFQNNDPLWLNHAPWWSILKYFI